MIESYNAHWTTSADSLKQRCYCINEPNFSDDIVFDNLKRIEAYAKRKYILNADSNPDIYLLEKIDINNVNMKDLIENINVFKDIICGRNTFITHLKTSLNSSQLNIIDCKVLLNELLKEESTVY